MLRRFVPISVALLLVAGCTSTVSPSPGPSPIASPRATATALLPTPTARPPGSTPAPSPSVTAAQADLDNLLMQLERSHPDPFHGIARDEWVAQLEALKSSLPDLSPFQAEVGLQRVVSLLSREGRDGHEFALPVDDGPALPFQSYEFQEGVFITRALAPYADLAGQEILALNGHPIADVLERLEPLIPRAGPATVPAFRPIYFHRTSVLRGLGLIDEFPVPITLRDAAGDEHDVEFEPVAFGQYATLVGQYGVGLPPNGTLYLSAPGDALWWRELPDSTSFYIRYEIVATISQADLEAIEQGATGPGVERVILDLRQNPGGDNHYYVGLLSLLADERIDRPGHLFVLTDRRTFSAASNFAADLEQTTSATFAGEQMGGGINFWGDARQVPLPNYPVPMQVGVATRYWQKSARDDPRLTIEPDISVPALAADYFAGRDPVLETVTTN